MVTSRRILAIQLETTFGSIYTSSMLNSKCWFESINSADAEIDFVSQVEAHFGIICRQCSEQIKSINGAKPASHTAPISLPSMSPQVPT